MADEQREATATCCDFLWIMTTKEGWLKLIEAIMTLLTLIICSTYERRSHAEYQFLIFVATSLFVLVILYIVLGVTHVFEKLPPALKQPILGLLCCILAALLLLIGSAIVYAKAEKYKNYTKPDPTPLRISGICGFISSALFLFEGVYYAVLCRRGPRRYEDQNPITEGELPDAFVQPSKPV